MVEFLRMQFESEVVLSPFTIAIRLIAAMILGLVVVFVYRRTRHAEEVVPSFVTTLLLLAILIAMVTQVIGDNVARAFSLVGALSIVRFRTVVRDTQDTAYVIFAVVVGMAAGAGDPWVAVIGIFIVSFAAYLMSDRSKNLEIQTVENAEMFTLKLKVSYENDLGVSIIPIIDKHVISRRFKSISTTEEGAFIELRYEIEFSKDYSVEALIRELNQTEGIQTVEMQNRKPKAN